MASGLEIPLAALSINTLERPAVVPRASKNVGLVFEDTSPTHRASTSWRSQVCPPAPNPRAMRVMPTPIKVDEINHLGMCPGPSPMMTSPVAISLPPMFAQTVTLGASFPQFTPVGTPVGSPMSGCTPVGVQRFTGPFAGQGMRMSPAGVYIAPDPQERFRSAF